MRLEHPLDLRGARATLDPPDDPLALDERERGHGLHLEPLRELRLLVDVDRGHAETGALLAREVRHQALHAPCRTGSGGAEEDEEWPRIITHGNDIFPANTPSKPGRRPALYTPGGMWETYRIGLALGLGIAIGGLVSALLAPRRALPLSAAGLASAAAGAAVGYAIGGWHEAVGGGAGGVLGALVVAVLVGTGWMAVARLVRAEVLGLRTRPFVEAAGALGATSPRILWRHVLPNALGPAIVAITLGVGGAILLESGLSFLGLGVQPPQPSWGNMIADGRDAIVIAPWVALAPGLALIATVVASTLLGDALRDRLVGEAPETLRDRA